jgi:hypothetical protein
MNKVYDMWRSRGGRKWDYSLQEEGTASKFWTDTDQIHISLTTFTKWIQYWILSKFAGYFLRWNVKTNEYDTLILCDSCKDWT